MNVLVISAHPDDETLGCGGSILKHVDAKDNVYWLIATQTYEPKWSKETIRKKNHEIEAVQKAFGVKGMIRFGFPAAKLELTSMDDLINNITEVVKKVNPQFVYVVSGSDVHSDHRILFDATASVMKPINMKKYGIRKLLCYETLSSTEAAAPQHRSSFMQNYYVDITAYLKRKNEIMKLYKTELQAYPYPRQAEGIKALARVRGATIGVEYAEAFCIIHEIGGSERL